MPDAEEVAARLAALEKALATALDRIATYDAVIAHMSNDLAILEAKVANREPTMTDRQPQGWLMPDGSLRLVGTRIYRERESVLENGDRQPKPRALDIHREAPKRGVLGPIGDLFQKLFGNGRTN